MVSDQLRRLAVEASLAVALEHHHVVRDQAMAAADELERALALADAARTEEQHADALHVDERSVGAGGHMEGPLACGSLRRNAVI
jgi:hypothetical protein